MSQRVHLLLSKPMSKNEFAFASPVKSNLHLIRNKGLHVRFFQSDSQTALSCDVLIVSSDFIAKKGLWKEPEDVLKTLENYRKSCSKLIWADMGDSTGTCQFSVLDLVDGYLKGSLLKDRSQYANSFYAGRIFSDYYHREFRINDFNEGEAHLKIPVSDAEKLEKLRLGWNQYFMSYSHAGVYRDTIYRKAGWIAKSTWTNFKAVEKKRNNLIHARFSANYKRETIAFQRRKLRELLGDFVPTSRVSRKMFYRELLESKFVVSPFGWGEICYRDFEAIAAGAVLVKPNCDHMETWPNFYRKGETYIDFDWDFRNWEECLTQIQEESSYEKYSELARVAQSEYQHIFSKEGRQQFALRFNDIVKSLDRHNQSKDA